MQENPSPYSILFNAITDAVAEMEAQNFGLAKALLIKAQQRTEEIYISDSEN